MLHKEHKNIRQRMGDLTHAEPLKGSFAKYKQGEMQTSWTEGCLGDLARSSQRENPHGQRVLGRALKVVVNREMHMDFFSLFWILFSFYN